MLLLVVLVVVAVVVVVLLVAIGADAVAFGVVVGFDFAY